MNGTRFQNRFFIYKTLDTIEQETNNNKETSTVLENKRFYQGSFNDTDLDYYKIIIPSNSQVDIGYVTNSNVSDIKIDVLGTSDNILASATSIDGESKYFHLGLSSGTYFLKLSSAGDTDINQDYIVSYNIYDTLPIKTEIDISLGTSKQSTIYHLNDESLLNLSISQKQSIQVEFIPPYTNSNYNIEILNNHNERINQMTYQPRKGLDYIKYTKTINNATYEPGTYKIKVTPIDIVNASEPFTISITELSIQTEIEPNTHYYQATDIEIDKPMNGRLFSTIDIDYYKLSTTEAKSLSLTFSCLGSSNDFYIALYKDSDANKITDIVSPNGQEVFLLIGFGPGDYFIKVIRSGEDAETLRDYTLKLERSDSHIEIETNNTLLNANQIHIGQHLKGKIYTNIDNDWFQFQLNEPKYLKLSFSYPETTSNYNLSLYKESEQGLIDSVSGKDISLDIGFTVGNYYLKISGAGSLNYYTLLIEESQQTNLEMESNNTLKFANAIEKDAPIQGRIYSSKDVDYYGFHIPEECIFNVSFKPSTTTGDYKVSLVNDSDQLFGVRNSANGAAYTINAFKAGNYYVKVENSGNVDQYSPYEINLSSVGNIVGIKQLVNLSVNGSTNDLLIGETLDLTLTASYSDTSTAIVSSESWSSINENVATVNQYGEVKAISEGTTTIVVVYGGITGQFSISVGEPEIVYKQHHGNLILVAGGGVHASNTLKNSTQYLSDLIYGRFKSRIFQDDDIFYINPMSWHDLDGDGFPDNIVDDDTPTVNDFGHAVTDWAVSQNTDGPLYIYLIDHGGIDKFMIFPDQILTASSLNTFLDNFQEAVNRKVVVVIEACKSGSFTDDIQSTTYERVIITSTDNKNAYLSADGRISFSQFFVDSLNCGNSLNRAYLHAKRLLTNMTAPYHTLAPKMIGPSLMADKTYIGGNFNIAASYPEITDTSSDQTVTAYETHSFYATLSDMEGITKVWAVVLPPGYKPPEVGNDFITPEFGLDHFELKKTSVENQYEGSYDNFTYNDIYRITFYAINKEGNVSVSNTINVTVEEGLGIDSDGDGMSNIWEDQYSKLDRHVDDALLDPDNDNLTNFEEFQHNTNPMDIDTDNDLMPDGYEVTWGFNPNVDDSYLDADGDGVQNYREFIDETNPLQKKSFLDHVLPQVLSVSPVSESKNNLPESSIEVIFSETMKMESLINANISIVGSESGVHTTNISYITMHHTLVINPVPKFNYNENVAVTLKSNFTDIAGNKLDGNGNTKMDGGIVDHYTWSFEIADSPEIIPTNPYDKNQDWIINDFELLDAIDAWAKNVMHGDIKANCDLDFYLLNIIDLWNGDSYIYIKENGEECFPWEPVE